MDLSYGPEYYDFREEVRLFLKEDLHFAPRPGSQNSLLAWQKLLVDRGYAGRTIPI